MSPRDPRPWLTAPPPANWECPHCHEVWESPELDIEYTVTDYAAMFCPLCPGRVAVVQVGQNGEIAMTNEVPERPELVWECDGCHRVYGSHEVLLECGNWPRCKSCGHFLERIKEGDVGIAHEVPQ